jgi:pyridoxine/pyridoxamine 5'-phosphate oxidase
MVELYRQEENPDSSTRAVWQSYQQSHVVAKHEALEKKIMNFATKYLFHTSKRYLTCRKFLRHEAEGITSPSK